jgi:hypothetical protein
MAMRSGGRLVLGVGAAADPGAFGAAGGGTGAPDAGLPGSAALAPAGGSGSLGVAC